MQQRMMILGVALAAALAAFALGVAYQRQQSAREWSRRLDATEGQLQRVEEVLRATQTKMADAQERQARATEDVADQLYRAQHPDFDSHDLSSRIAVGSTEDFKKLSGHGKPSSK